MKKIELEEKIKSLEKQIVTMQCKYEELLDDYNNARCKIDTYKGKVEDVKNTIEYKIGGLISDLIKERISEHDIDPNAHNTYFI